MGCLIIVKTVTQAQKSASILSRVGVASSIEKPPVSLGKGSCSYAVRINYADLPRAIGALRRAGIATNGVYVMNAGRYREV